MYVKNVVINNFLNKLKMGYIYRINNVSKVNVHATITLKEKSESLRIILYKLKIELKTDSSYKEISMYAFSPIEMEYYKLSKPHVDNIVQQLSQIYNNYYPDFNTFVSKNGLSESINTGCITEKQIRGHLLKCYSFKKDMDELTGSNEFFVDTKYLITNKVFYFDTYSIVYISKDKMHPKVIACALDMSNAKHIKESTFMKNTYDILMCSKTNIFNFIEPTFGYKIIKK